MNWETIAVPAAAAGGQGDWVARSDLAFCLARAFLPPPPEWTVNDWAEPLLADVAELGAMLGLDTDELRAAFAAEVQRASTGAAGEQRRPQKWLVEYARLFLVPPVPVSLNAGVYLEGSLAGVSGQMIASCYRAAGFEPDSQFRDLPDHIAMQLEFLARLLQQAAAGDRDAALFYDEFRCKFVHAWAQGLEAACDDAARQHAAARVYASLARLLRQLVDHPDQSEEPNIPV